MCHCFVLIGQFVVIVTNIIITLIGIAVTAVGVLIKFLGDEVGEMASILPVKTMFIVLLVAGIILLMLGLFGCIGASCKITWPLILNAIGLSILAAGKIYLLILVGQILSQSTEILTKVLTELHESTDNKTLHLIEYTVKCCGINGSDTYTSAGMAVPLTCCSEDSVSETATESIDPDEILHSFCTNPYDGCVSVLNQYVDEFGNLMKIILISTISVEIATVVFDFIIACFGKSKR